ncbi:DUF1360 domain-containing protein [Labedaea rhizosphaerae]|uniref:Uncharacterized protein DUF1360 n=1 Tax=Labedaea rhizosphaerae TaxID=598644 RepID=A0A4R6SJ48_LABRH|nr:DUF1360 domain-containing protein [Labedaea rhizosphaerae]TDQ00949.1 uncharacterized protein DUF1360 [Labedaea rhizosphaerae]
MGIAERVKKAAHQVQQAYAGSEERPLGGYLAVMGAYGGVATGLVALGKATGARLPDRWTVGDAAMLGVATFKASRLLTKDAVTSPLRAPFTKFEGPAGDGEVNESVRGTGVQHAVGELLVCPFCTNVWVGGALGAGMVFVPRLTRLATLVLTAFAAADALHLAYDKAKQSVEG